MEQALQVLQTFSPIQSRDPRLYRQHDAAIRQYVLDLESLSKDKETRSAIARNPIVYLKTLDAAVNSIGYLTVINIANREKTIAFRQELLDLILEFFLKFDACQVRFLGESFHSLLTTVSSGLVFSPLVATKVVATAILRLDPTSSVFTSTHLNLARLAYTSNCVEPALPVFDADILYFAGNAGSKEAKTPLCDPHLPPLAYLSTSTGLTDQYPPAAVLEYNVLRGIAYMSRRDWAKARAALEQVIAHPSRDRGVSVIMTEAHKKWVLVGLLHKGKAPELPWYTSPAAKASYQALSKPYVTVSGLFNTPKVAELKNEVEANRQTWEDDGNVLLMAEVMSAYQKWQVLNLRDVYQRISISQVRMATLSADTGKPLPDDASTLVLVREMLESGFVDGEMQEVEGGGESYLAFGSTGCCMPEAEFAVQVERGHRAIEWLSKQYQLTNERLGSHKDYLRHLVRDQKRVDADKEMDPAIGFETQVEDEDLMTGVLAHA